MSLLNIKTKKNEISAKEEMFNIFSLRHVAVICIFPTIYLVTTIYVDFGTDKLIVHERYFSSYQTSEEVAMVVADCIAMDNPPIRMRTSEWSEDFTKLKTQSDPDGKLQQADVIKRYLT